VPNYRRNYEGEVFFFTVVTRGRRDLFAEETSRRLLSSAIRSVQEQWPWEMAGISLLPDHLHMLWRMPAGDRDYSRRMALLKRRFTKTYLASGGREAPVGDGQVRHRLRGVWQRRFWEPTALEPDDLEIRFDYTHYNPVKHGYVRRPRYWPPSTFHRYVELGHYAANWGASEPQHLQGLDFE